MDIVVIIIWYFWELCILLAGIFCIIRPLHILQGLVGHWLGVLGMSTDNIVIEHLDLPRTCLKEECELYHQPK